MWSVRRDDGPTNLELERLGLTREILEDRAPEIDAATPAFAQTRGKPWPEVASASTEFLRLLRELPDAVGADAVIAHFQRAERQRFH